MKALVFSVLVVLLMSVWCAAMSKHELQDFTNFLKKTSSLDQRLKGGINSDDDSDEESDDPSDDAWETSGKFEGDLILNDRQRRLIVEDVAEGLSRNGLKDSTKRWPDNEVIYYIQKEHFSSDQVQAIKDGIDDIAQASCIKFRPYKKGDRDAVVIQGNRRGCFSQVGYQSGYQVLNLSGRHPVGRGCFRHGTVVHEMLHTLGFYHMQSSPDRDDYINVVWENIIEPARHNFKKYNSFSVSDFGVGYDYDSVLHYSRRAFSANGGDTLVPKQGGASIGQRVGLSDKDTQKLNKMYCDADSNSFDAEEVTAKPTNKKKAKNEPFQGHGIGYHQGKAVVIKLPAAETFTLPDRPSYRMFDYFSKATQAVPPTLAQGFRTGQEMIKDNPVKISNHDANHKTTSPQVFTNTKTIEDFKTKNTEIPKYDGVEKANTNHDSSKSEEGSGETEDNHNETKNYMSERDLIEAFRKMEEIIKQQVYPKQPSNTPNDFIHKTDYSEFYTPNRQYEGYKDAEKIEKLFKDQYSKKPVESKQDNLKLFDSYLGSNKNNEEFDSSYGTKLPLKKMSDEPYKIPKHFTAYEKELEYRNKYKSNYKPETEDSSNSSEADTDKHYTIFNKQVPLVEPWFKTDNIQDTDDHDYSTKLSKQNPEHLNEYKTTKKYSSDDQNHNDKAKSTIISTSPLAESKKDMKEVEEVSDTFLTLKDLSQKHDFSKYYQPQEFLPKTAGDSSNDSDEDTDEHYKIFDKPVPSTAPWFKSGIIIKNHDNYNYSFKPSKLKLELLSKERAPEKYVSQKQKLQHKDENANKVTTSPSKEKSEGNEEKRLFDTSEALKDLSQKHDFSDFYQPSQYQPGSKRDQDQPYTILGLPVPSFSDTYKPGDLGYYLPNERFKSYLLSTAEPIRNGNTNAKLTMPNDPYYDNDSSVLFGNPVRLNSEKYTMGERAIPQDATNKTTIETFSYSKESMEEDVQHPTRIVMPRTYEVTEEVEEPSAEKADRSSEITKSDELPYKLDGSMEDSLSKILTRYDKNKRSFGIL